MYQEWVAVRTEEDIPADGSLPYYQGGLQQTLPPGDDGNLLSLQEGLPTWIPSSSGVVPHANTHSMLGSDPVAIEIEQVNNLSERLQDIPATGNFIVGQLLTPAPDGLNNVFRTEFPPAFDKETIFYNGVEQTRGVSADYVISSNVVTFSFVPEQGSKVAANYIYI